MGRHICWARGAGKSTQKTIQGKRKKNIERANRGQTKLDLNMDLALEIKKGANGRRTRSSNRAKQRDKGKGCIHRRKKPERKGGKGQNEWMGLVMKMGLLCVKKGGREARGKSSGASMASPTLIKREVWEIWRGRGWKEALDSTYE